MLTEIKTKQINEANQFLTALDHTSIDVGVPTRAGTQRYWDIGLAARGRIVVMYLAVYDGIQTSRVRLEYDDGSAILRVYTGTPEPMVYSLRPSVVDERGVREHLRAVGNYAQEIRAQRRERASKQGTVYV